MRKMSCIRIAGATPAILEININAYLNLTGIVANKIKTNNAGTEALLIFYGNTPVPPVTTYYIDPAGNDGGGHTGLIGDPWLTLSYACSRVLIPNSIIHINAGNYIEPNRCDLARGVSIIGVGITSHIISNYVSGANEGSIHLASVAEGTLGNQVISDILLDGNALTATNGIYVGLRSNVNINNCTIQDFNWSGIFFRGSIIRYFIVNYSHDNKVSYNNIINCSTRSAPGKQGNLIISGQQDMIINNNTFTNNVRAAGENGNLIDAVDGEFINLKIHHNNFTKAILTSAGVWDFHIEIWDCRGGVEIYNNNFYEGYQCIDTDGYTNTKGIYPYSISIHDNYFELAAPLNSLTFFDKIAINIEGNHEYVEVYKNHIKNFVWGIFVDMPPFVAAPNLITNVKIYNNILQNIGYIIDWWAAGILIQGSNVINTIEHIFIYDNVYIGGTRNYTFVYILESCNIDEIYIQNNQIQNSYFGGIIVDGAGIGALNHLYVQNNQYFNNGTDGITYPNGGSAAVLVETNNLIGNPLFVGGGNYHLTVGSPSINTGLAIAGYVTDYENIPIIDPPNIGCYETV